MKLSILIFQLLVTFSLYSQDRLLVKDHIIYDLVEIKDAAFVTIGKTKDDFASIVTKFSTPGDVLLSKKILLDNFDTQDIGTVEYSNKDERIYIFGTATLDTFQFFIFLELNLDLEILEVKKKPIIRFLGSIFKATLYDQRVLAFQKGESSHIANASSLYTYNITDDSLKEFYVPNSSYQDVTYIDTNHILIDRGTFFDILDSSTGKITQKNFLFSQSVQYLAASTIYKDTLTNNYYLFTSAGLAANVHPDITKSDNYSGVLYKLDNNSSILKYKRLGKKQEFPAPTKSMVFYDSENIYVGVLNFRGGFNNILSTKKYFTISKLNSDLDVKWEQTLIPNSDAEYIWLQGIEVMKNGTCLAYGRQSKDPFFNENLNGFIVKFDENGDIIPLGDITDTKTTDFYTIKMFPNPVVDQFIIELENNQKQLNFKLFDAQGKLVLTNKTLSTGVNTLDISSLRSGSYYYQISDDIQILKSDIVIKI